MGESTELITEADIMAEIIEPGFPDLPVEAARVLAGLRFNEGARRRIDELAEKNRQGSLTESEHALLDKYLRVGNFLNLLKAKAHVTLAKAR
jgi:hypothetical protein